MKKIVTLALAVIFAQSVNSFASERVQCAVYKGTYMQKELLKNWDSNDNTNPDFKFYSNFKIESLGVSGLWGVNIGPTVSGDSKDRFSILVYGPKNEKLAAVDTDSKGPIDVAVWIPAYDVSITCLGTE